MIKNKNFGAVKEQNAQSPDQNGGILGADNPTFPRFYRLGLDTYHPWA